MYAGALSCHVQTITVYMCFTFCMTMSCQNVSKMKIVIELKSKVDGNLIDSNEAKLLEKSVSNTYK